MHEKLEAVKHGDLVDLGAQHGWLCGLGVDIFLGQGDVLAVGDARVRGEEVDLATAVPVRVREGVRLAEQRRLRLPRPDVRVDKFVPAGVQRRRDGVV